MNKLISLLLIVLFLSACQTHEHVVLVSEETDALQSPAQAVSQSTRSAATALLNALTDEQKELAQHDIQAPLKNDWHFIPRERQGLMLGNMTVEQKRFVHTLMQTALSDSGYLKATDIIWLETVLYEMSNQSPMRDPGKYALQIFGDPTNEQAAWGWRLEGHHLSINLTYTPEGIGVTPLFFGTNPAVVQQGPLAGKRILADAHNLAVELAKSMSDEQRKKMMLQGKPRDIVTSPSRETELKEQAGIQVNNLSAEQRQLLFDLLEVHLDSFAMDHRALPGGNLFSLVFNDPLNHWRDFRFAWAGPIGVDESFYYRVVSRVAVIEYSCQGKNHVHCVVHDLTDPLQEDLLKKHFEQHEH